MTIFLRIFAKKHEIKIWDDAHPGNNGSTIRKIKVLISVSNCSIKAIFEL